jgi:SAM-dependent methyltransferase
MGGFWMTRPAFSTFNAAKANFDHVYVEKDPRQYFNYLGQLDYIIPHLAQPIFEQLVRARAATQSSPVTVLDLGSSYGVNGALMKYALGYDALRDRYTAPSLQGLSSEDMLKLDRAFYLSWPRDPHVRVVGLDISQNAVDYAQASGTLDIGLCADLEAADPSPDVAAVISEADIIVSTGCVGYVTSKTFNRVMALARGGRTAWVASFVLRMFPYDKIAATLAGYGLETEKFEGATFVQRRFANREEMEAAVRAVESRGIDTRGHETEGVYHADLYVSRPRRQIEQLPLQKLVNVVSGANKPWTIGTNVLGRHGPGARLRARGAVRALSAAPGS